MTLYKYTIVNRNDEKPIILNANTLEVVNINLESNKLFNGDIFTYNKDKVEFVSSFVRELTNIPGVLIIEGNKTFGRENKHKIIDGKTYTRNSLKIVAGKLLYKFIPNDLSLPPFLVPYEMNKMDFTKFFNNLYVIIKFKSWDDKHPHGSISQIIGNVNDLNSFYEYQIYCKSLNISLRHFQNKLTKIIDKVNIDIISKKNIENRLNQNVFTIDPETTKDYDDAFSIIQKDETMFIVSIYISNVPVILDELDLWSDMTERVSTIYLPNGNKPMLPTILSEGLCSLKKDEKRIALTMDIYIKNNEIIDVKLLNSLIKISNNYIYESETLLKSNEYKLLFNLATDLSYRYRLCDIVDSHNVVEYFMLLMNNKCGDILKGFNRGICRVNHTIILLPIPISHPNTKYELIEGNLDTKHSILGFDIYSHITSPIRRLVDILNMIELQECLGLYNFLNISDFYNNWKMKLDFINKQMKDIKKIQNDCNLLYLCLNNDDILNKEYEGKIIDKKNKNNMFEYYVYIFELKLFSKGLTNKDMNVFDSCNLKLFIFNDEEKIKKKIRIQIL